MIFSKTIIFKNYCITLKKDVELAKLKYYNYKFESNSKATWRNINEISAKAKRSQSPCLDVDTVVTNDSQTAANEFNEYFVSCG